MSFFSLFGNFDSISTLVIILIIFVIIFLICLSSSLIKKNKMLKEELKIREYNKDNNIDNELNDNNIISDSIDSDILNELKEKPYEEDSLSLEEEEDINEILSSMPDKDNVEVMPYAKNVLRNLSASGQTSPVNIGKSAVDVPKVKVTSYVKKENNEEKKLKHQDIEDENNVSNNNSNQDYINEIKERLEKENEPQTIELTDYEKRQEEEAIISYKELIKVKDRLYNITDDEEIETFIDELKEFKEDLRKDS